MTLQQIKLVDVLVFRTLRPIWTEIGSVDANEMSTTNAENSKKMETALIRLSVRTIFCSLIKSFLLCELSYYTSVVQKIFISMFTILQFLTYNVDCKVNIRAQKVNVIFRLCNRRRSRQIQFYFRGSGLWNSLSN